MKYHIADGDQQRGPYTLDELWRVEFGPDTLVWRDGMPDWERADSIADLRTILAGKVPELEPVGRDDDPADDEGELEIKVPTDVRPAERITVFPGLSEPHFQPGQSLQYAGGGGPAYMQHGPLPMGLAITSIVLGILALFLSIMAICLWPFSGPLAITAIVFGHIARHNANRGVAAGGGMALAGLICGYLALALTAFFMVGFLGLMAGP